MKLINVQIKTYRNIVDSGQVEIEPDVTCLVGKNESGKTAFLHALHRLLPEQDNVSFNVQDDYPAWRQKKDRKAGNSLEEVEPVRASFELEYADIEQIEEWFGPQVLSEDTIALSRKYNGEIVYDFHASEAQFVNHVVARVDFPEGMERPNKVQTIKDLREYADELREEEESNSNASLAENILNEIEVRLEGQELSDAIWEFVQPTIPRFLYFSEYSRLPYSVDIERVLTTDAARLDEGELTARALLRLGGADDDYLSNPNYVRRKRELDNVANAITRDIRPYWTQNPDLRVEPDITTVAVPAGKKGQQVAVDKLMLGIRDERHWLTLRFDEHSTGFQWFFSFVAAFSKYEETDEPLIILLDEPALGLHAKAQGDFLRYVEERLTPRCQVIYTTHSPFMVQPGRLDRVRLVEDKTSRDDAEPVGAVLTSDVTSTDADTLFPLQGALGYDLAQHLFIGPHNLVVEGTSDFTYLTVISDYLRDQEEDRAVLDERWSIVPVGGADLVPSFVALLGTHLDITVLVDAQKKGHQKLSRLANKGILYQKRIISVGGVLGLSEADIEDVFAEKDYLDLYNRAFKTSHALNDLTGNDPIVRRIARLENKS